MAHISDVGCFVTLADSLVIIDPNKLSQFISNDLAFRGGGEVISMPLQLLHPIKPGLWSVYAIIAESTEAHYKVSNVEQLVCVSTSEMEWNFSSVDVLNALDWTHYTPPEGVIFPYKSEIDTTSGQVGIFCLESIRNAEKDENFNNTSWLQQMEMATCNKVQVGLSDLPNSPIGCVFSPICGHKVELKVVNFHHSNEIWAFKLSKS
ncbi:hypothetical protein BMR1_02g04045 [Babesia microti strain RI]|uniref:Uncharacterized protein n=1 Tax=Babesia microti (strain RI) TaxID=1133968 RepID=I7J6P0_BABMR|nr:hypothetical protein BMR1_02g04045 [Babesia microti strain RI]CCF73957.1 hypothetical protein BMR1_02g04045 [Babesia microti strain RI]|eukprot:XP_012648566.1 hypothetical protein BMR1_02g04045 [Babesia microti strain RI]